MNANNNEKSECILDKALELYKKGKSIPEILDLFPECREELKDLFRVTQMLTNEKDNVVPPKELLAEIISKLQFKENVTNAKESRYTCLYRGEPKGRPSLNIIIRQITNLMTWNWKMVLPIGVVAILVVMGLYSQLGKGPQIAKEQQPSPIDQEQMGEEPATTFVAEKPADLPPATGSVDDVVDTVIAGIDNELAVLSEHDGDIALVDVDSQTLSDFGQTYDENEF